MKWILQSAKQKLTRSVNPLTEMDEQDSKMFIAAFDDYMKHCESDSEEDWENARQYTDSFLEEKAAELEITVDYYMQEFM